MRGCDLQFRLCVLWERRGAVPPAPPALGKVAYHGENLYDADVDPIEVRRRIGMVFQEPNPFPKSIYDNIAYGPRVNGVKGNLDDLVEEALSPAPSRSGRT